MNYLQKLREARAKKVEEAQGIFNKAKGESRSLNADETTQYDALMTEVRSLATQITQAEEQEELEREAAGRTEPLNTHNTTEARDLGKYSLLKAVRSTMGGKLDGIELEMHQEAEKESRANNYSIQGVGVPQMLLARRDNSITMPTQPEDGSAVMAPATVRPIIDLHRPKSVLVALGATFLTGLVGDVTVPAMASGAVSAWADEVEELVKSNQKFKNAKLKPNRLGTWVRRSKQFLLQTDPSVDTMLRRDLELSIVAARDKAAINGSGNGNEPLGVLNTPGILALALGATGGVVTRDMLILLESLVEDQNIDLTSPGYLINVAVKSALKRTKVDAGSGLFLMNSNTELNGYPVASSTLVPKNITKGGASNLSAGIFGDWSNLLMAQWGGLDITTDPYTRAKFGEVEIIIQTFLDSLVQEPASFAAVKDIVTT
jgi:HK97 family phage major capsid protein